MTPALYSRKCLPSLVSVALAWGVVGCVSDPPTVEIVSHSDGEFVCGAVGTVRVEATDDEGVEEVIIYIDDEEGVRLANPPYEWLCDIFVPYLSRPTIRARATDEDGNSAEDAVRITMVGSAEDGSCGSQLPD